MKTILTIHFSIPVTGFPNPIGADDDSLPRGEAGFQIVLINKRLLDSQRQSVSLQFAKLFPSGIVDNRRGVTRPYPEQLPLGRLDTQIKQSHEPAGVWISDSALSLSNSAAARAANIRISASARGSQGRGRVSSTAKFPRILPSVAISGIPM
jgi:hypothetical protein